MKQIARKRPRFRGLFSGLYFFLLPEFSWGATFYFEESAVERRAGVETTFCSDLCHGFIRVDEEVTSNRGAQLHEVVYEGQAGGLAEPSAKALFGHAGDVGDFAEGDGVLVVVLDVFRDAFHALTELLAHDVGIGIVG